MLDVWLECIIGECEEKKGDGIICGAESFSYLVAEEVWVGRAVEGEVCFRVGDGDSLYMHRGKPRED